MQWFRDRVMETLPQQNETGANATSPDRGWLGACGYWIMTAGAAQAFSDGGAFPLLALITGLVGMCIAVRVTVRQFRSGFVIDRRNYVDLSRSQWFKRRGEP